VNRFIFKLDTDFPNQKGTINRFLYEYQKS
jgi:hypothetical protein